MWINFLFSLFSVDIDECARGTHQCHPAATCTNTAGSYQCTCPTGSAGNGRTCTGKQHAIAEELKDKLKDDLRSSSCDTNAIFPFAPDLCDECRNIPAGCGTHNCNVNVADCTNTIGSFQCSCRFGQAADGVTCTRMWSYITAKMFILNLTQQARFNIHAHGILPNTTNIFVFQLHPGQTLPDLSASHQPEPPPSP